MTRVAIYLRVSSSDGSQFTDNQRPDVEQLCRTRGYSNVTVYEEQASAVKHRPVYDKMLKDAKRGRFSVLVVWAIDRFGRSMIGNVSDVLELDRVKVQVVSVRETWLDTGGPVRNLLLAIFSWVSEQERERLVLRTKAGMIAAKKRGSKIGRPRARVDVDQLHELHEQGLSVREMAAKLGIGSSTVQRRLRAFPRLRVVA
jgi:DNA invertase Pin-like site-specific DNA recombinase